MPVAAKLHYFLHEGGTYSRPAVVLIHGEAGDHLSWPSELRRLSGFLTYTLDLPGHGKSEGPGLQSINDYSSRILNFLNEVGLSSPILVGHGMGGAIALTVASEHATRVSGIVLVASGARLPIATAMLENAANPSTFPFALQALHAATISSQMEPRLKEWSLKRLSAIRPTLLHGDLLACDAFDLTDRLESLRIPILIICGTEDKFTPLRYSENLAHTCQGAALQTIDGAGHLVMLEQPRRVVGLLNVFLASLPSRG